MKNTCSTTMPLLLMGSILTLSTASAANLCNYESAHLARLDASDFAGCMKLRSKGVAAIASPIVWSLTDQSVFATTCPVTIRVADPHPTECSNLPAEALKTGDVVRIDEWGPDKLELVIQRNGVSVFHPKKPQVFLSPATVTIGKEEHTVGYFADALVYQNAAHTGVPVPASYYVYLEYMMQDGQPVRWYQVEVFDDSKKCREEIPGSAAAGTEVVPCTAAAAKNAKIRLRSQTILQLPSGGGGEPPPG